LGLESLQIIDGGACDFYNFLNELFLGSNESISQIVLFEDKFNEALLEVRSAEPLQIVDEEV